MLLKALHAVLLSRGLQQITQGGVGVSLGYASPSCPLDGGQLPSKALLSLSGTRKWSQNVLENLLRWIAAVLEDKTCVLCLP